MTSVIKAITKFQNVALITTAGAVAYWYANEAHENSAQEGAEALKSAAPETNTKNAHDLKGQVVDKEKQVRDYWKLYRQTLVCAKLSAYSM